MEPVTLNTLATRLAAEHAAATGALPTTVAGRERRRRALAAFTRQGFPSHREENWRYANLHALTQARFVPATASATAIETRALPPVVEGYTRYTFVDGVFAPELSHSARPPAGVFIASVHEDVLAAPAGEDAAAAPEDAPADQRFAWLNEAFATDGIRIEAGRCAQPARFEILFIACADAQDGASYPRLALQAAPGARVALIERHLGAGDGANLVNGAVQITVGAGAAVDHYRLQHAGQSATWIDTLQARVAAGGAYQLHLAQLGADSARSTVHVALEGARAAVALNAVSVPGPRHVHDVHAVIEHAAPDTATEQRFRGIAAEQARVGFNGRIVVRAEAQRALSRQSLRGLLAGRQAEVDVRPQLEIYTDEVQCSHGATAGKLDENMLFYLLSRGLDPHTAQRLLEWAFLEDVIAQIGEPKLRRQIERTLADRMAGGAALLEMLR